LEGDITVSWHGPIATSPARVVPVVWRRKPTSDGPINLPLFLIELIIVTPAAFPCRGIRYPNPLLSSLSKTET